MGDEDAAFDYDAGFLMLDRGRWREYLGGSRDAYHTMKRHPPKGSNVVCAMTPMSEKKAPSQSIVKKPQWIPTTRPPRFQSSK